MCWALSKKKEIKRKVTQIRMIRYICGVTRLDRIGNKYIKESLSVTDKAGKMRENRSRWFRYFQRKNIDYIVKKIDELKNRVKSGKEQSKKESNGEKLGKIQGYVEQMNIWLRIGRSIEKEYEKLTPPVWDTSEDNE